MLGRALRTPGSGATACTTVSTQPTPCVEPSAVQTATRVGATGPPCRSVPAWGCPVTGASDARAAALNLRGGRCGLHRPSGPEGPGVDHPSLLERRLVTRSDRGMRRAPPKRPCPHRCGERAHPLESSATMARPRPGASKPSCCSTGRSWLRSRTATRTERRCSDRVRSMSVPAWIMAFVTSSLTTTQASGLRSTQPPVQQCLTDEVPGGSRRRRVRREPQRHHGRTPGPQDRGQSLSHGRGHHEVSTEGLPPQRLASSRTEAGHRHRDAGPDPRVPARRRERAQSAWRTDLDHPRQVARHTTRPLGQRQSDRAVQVLHYIAEGTRDTKDDDLTHAEGDDGGSRKSRGVATHPARTPHGSGRTQGREPGKLQCLRHEAWAAFGRPDPQDEPPGPRAAAASSKRDRGLGSRRNPTLRPHIRQSQCVIRGWMTSAASTAGREPASTYSECLAGMTIATHDLMS